MLKQSKRIINGALIKCCCGIESFKTLFTLTGLLNLTTNNVQQWMVVNHKRILYFSVLLLFINENSHNCVISTMFISVQ